MRSFNYCHFRAFAYATLDKLWVIFLFLTFAVLLNWMMANSINFSCLCYVICQKNLLIFWVLPKNVQSPGESQTSCHGNTLTVSALYPKFIKLSFPIRVNENYAIRYHCCHWTQCWAQPSPNTKWHLDRFSRFCTAHGRETLYFTIGRPFSLFKLLLPMGGSGPPI